MTNEPKRILVVDDDELARLEIAHSVEQLGHAVSQAGNGAQALEMLRAESFDLVLLDLLMPEVDGAEVLRQMKADAALSVVPVIVITAVDDPEGARKSIGLGAVDHLTKPVNHQLLSHRLGVILPRG